MNIKHVVFFNAAARGDVFISRGFIKDVIEKILKPNNITYSYSTCWSHYFTKDISPNYNRWNYLDGSDKPPRIIDPQCKWFIDNETLYFNTWYCANYQKYHSIYGCSLKTIHCIFSDFYEIFGSKISENLLEYLPVIDYSFYNVGSVNEHFLNKDKKNVFISTSYPRSDQASTESLTGLVYHVANKYKNCNFYITDNIAEGENIHYTGEILYNQKFEVATQGDLVNSYPMGEYPHSGSSDNSNRNYKNTIDLIECSYFSLFCDVIVGKSTGTYSYSLCKENILNPKTKFMGICAMELASAKLHEIMHNKFYSITHSTEYNEQKNIDLLCKLIEN